MCVKEGDTVNFEVTTFDTLYSPNQITYGDSVKLSWNAGIKGSIFTMKGTTGKRPSCTFCWVVPKGVGRMLPYTFSVHAIDNSCPRRAEVYKGFSIYVGNCDRFAAVAKPHVFDVLLYPMPVKAGELLHYSINGIHQVQLLNITGKTVLVESNNAGAIRIPLQIPSGIYSLKTSQNGVEKVSKILVEQ